MRSIIIHPIATKLVCTSENGCADTGRYLGSFGIILKCHNVFASKFLDEQLAASQLCGLTKSNKNIRYYFIFLYNIDARLTTISPNVN